MTMAEDASQQWRKSSACFNTECVEVAARREHVLIRDSADKKGPVLEFSIEQWRDFASKFPSARELSAVT
jgi:hypothetical protein